MADPTCPTCPAEKRIERYTATNPAGIELRIVRCIECGNQTVDGEPNQGPAATEQYEETVNGGERVIRRPKAKP
jgi:Zn ribbon nucleic-acid-binding protein